jgi:AICAR transformylase/IMP cyclohydrolase PurH
MDDETKKIRDALAEIMLLGVESKPVLLSQLTEVIETASVTEKGLELFSEFDASQIMDDPGVMAKMIASLNKINKFQAAHIKLLTTMIMTYVLSDSFTADAAKAATRLGKGQEALSKLYKQKRKGG